LLTVDRLSLKGEAAIASFQLLIDNLTASLDVQIGNQRRFVKHPTLPLPPDDPNADRHHGEWTTTTDLTFTSRFMFAVKDLDADVNVPVLGRTANFFLNWVIDELEWLFEDKFEETVRDTVREFLATNSNDIATKVRQTLLELAEREHELHTVSRDGRDLIIEHYDAFDTPPRPASLRPPRSPRPLAVPIDGPMPDHADARLATVDHIVVVMMENRSFDHMLGWLSHPVHFSGILRHDINGLTGKERVPLGGSVGGTPKTPSFNPQKEMRPDPDHSFTTTAQQIGDGSMDGFIPAYRQRIKDAPEILDFRLEDERRIVECQTAKEVPVYDYIAREYCVLDRWFASFPGPTFVNRMCEIAGLTTSETNTGLRPDLGYLSSLTFFELLDKARVPWRVYEGDVSFLRTFDRYRLEFDKIRPLKEFLDGGDAGLGPVTFLDPNVTGMPSADHAEDDHPATDVQWGQLFLQKVIERLQASVSWKKTMLIITYDEHGGFYDHLAPPGTARFHRANPDVSEDIPRVHEKEGKYGVRVPALVVSPHVKRMSVGHHIYDHTTIARTILQRFAPNQVGFMPERVRRARHLGELLQTKPRLDKPKPPRVPPPNPVRVRVNKFLPNVDLARLKPDPEDARVFLARIGAPSRAPE